MSNLSRPASASLAGTAVDPAGPSGVVIDPTEITQPGGPYGPGEVLLTDGAGSWIISPVSFPADHLVVVKMDLALVSKVSTSVLPDGAVVLDCWLDITTAYDNSATWAVTRTGDIAVEIMEADANDPAVLGVYHAQQLSAWGSTGAGTVTATVTGGPTVGAAVLYIAYVTPSAID